MKNTIIVALLILFAAAIPAKAQNKKLSTGQRTELKQRFEDNRARLNLNPTQVTEVRAIDSAYLISLADLKKSSSGKFAKLKKFKGINADRNKKMKGVLNDDQYKQYLEFKEEMKQELKEMNQKQ
ncbi:hypothetical protein LJ707_05180 [Mucilaginibacter sp. UR6-1]|uniref:hypothetical protein n=1 Tax=Mucilaginibacter sp. UR6-1 TaxID=1435643 RepID=UPI001E48D400|nr:hypothetical protein [Mucilaginibacter sp. UR6-1]MCC8408312.1 hypothetical protein [Mucilaginibacter sp. UR6-1]